LVKTCYKCHKSKYLTEFNAKKTAKDGLQFECKDCQKEYRLQNREDILFTQKHWYKQKRLMERFL
jgi:peptide subunit release factor 1 (eRF1)